MRKHKKGFTIVELVIVIAVIGILSAILIPTFVNVTQNAKDAALKSDLANAYSMYVADAADGEKEEKVNNQTAYFVDVVTQDDVLLVKGTSQYRFLGGEWREAVGTDEIISPKYKVAYTGDDKTTGGTDVIYGGYTIYSKTDTGVLPKA